MTLTYNYNKDSLKIIKKIGLPMKFDGSVQCPCPVHGGDNPNGFSYSPELDRWRCWTHQCHEEYGTDIIGLLAGVRKISRDKARRLYYWLIKNKSDSTLVDIDKLSNNVQKDKGMVFYDYFFKDKVFDAPYLESRGIYKSTIKKYRIFRYTQDKTKPLYGRECIPIHNMNNDVIGFAGRRTSLLNSNNHTKWRYVPKGLKLSQTLFNINNLNPNSNIIFLVEGTIDVLKLAQNNLDNVLSSFTCNLSNYQKNILLDKGINKIVCLFDPDEAGKKGYEIIKRKYGLFFDIFDGSRFLDNKDPGDWNNKDIIETLIPLLSNLEIY